MTPVIIALGSNVGDRGGNLALATRLLVKEVSVLKLSPYYETEPMYEESQAKFLNAALLAETDISPRALLALLKSIEQEVGRLKRTKNGPREIDLDLIAYGAARYRFTGPAGIALDVPHPRVAERRFVLQPLADIAPDMLLPGIGIVKDLLLQTKGQAESVTLYEDASLSLSGS